MTELSLRRAMGMRVYRKIRIWSFIITAGVAGVSALIIPLWLAPLPLGVIVLLLFSPAGGYLSIFTMWSGYYIQSCPFCPLVHFKKLEVEVFKCADCGKSNFAIHPVIGPEAKIESGDKTYCSMECYND